MNLQTARKGAVALVVAGVALVAFFIQFDPGFQTGAIAVTVAVFNVIGVYAAKNHSVDDAQKAVQALTGSALALVGFYVTVNPSDAENVAAAALAIVNVVAVYQARNLPTVSAGQL